MSVFDESVNSVLGDVFLEIEKCNEVKFVKIGVDKECTSFSAVVA
jgi:hypothetical protein